MLPIVLPMLPTNYELRGRQPVATRCKLQVLLPQKVVELLLLLHTCGKWQQQREKRCSGVVDGAEICILSEFSGIAFGLHAALGTRGN